MQIVYGGSLCGIFHWRILNLTIEEELHHDIFEFFLFSKRIAFSSESELLILEHRPTPIYRP